MNANEMADALAEVPIEIFGKVRMIDVRVMLRQQQAEIEALKAKYEPKPLTKEQEQAVLAVWKQIQPHLFKEGK